MPSRLGRPSLQATALTALALGVATLAGCGGGSSDSGSGGDGDSNKITATSGADIFKAANCSSCHTLAAASAEGRIGPNLDDEKPSVELAKGFITDGAGSMPAFKNRLSEEQIDAVATYVAEVAGD